MAAPSVDADKLRELLSRLSVGGGSGASEIVAALRAQPQHAGVQADGCEALATLLPGNAAEAEAAVAAGGVAALVHAARAHAADVGIQRSCMQALMHVLNGIIERRLHTHVTSVADKSLAALVAHALDESLVNAAEQRLSTHAPGALEVALATLTAHAADASVAHVSCGVALLLLMYGGAVEQAQAAAAGAFPGVVAAMRAHAGVAHMQAVGCSLLGHLLLGAHRSTLRVSAVTAGAPGVVCAALRAFPGDVDVQSLGCRALSRLFEPSQSAAADTPLATQAVAIALAAMGAHSGAAAVQDEACVVLRVVFAGAHGVAAPLAAAAVRGAVSAMRAHPLDAAVQLNACNVLQRACQHVPANIAAAHDAGGCGATVAALRTHVGMAEVVSIAAAAMCALVSSPDCIDEYAARAGAAGAGAAVVDAMRAHPTHGSLNVSCCTMLSVLSACVPAEPERIVAAGGIEATVGSSAAGVCTYPDDDPMMPQVHQLIAVTVLSELLRGSEVRTRRAVCAGALEALSSFAPPLREDGKLPALLQQLRDAAERHDGSACALAACVRCAGGRARGALCALPGCGARRRPGSTRSLLRCGRCRTAAYCSAAHQRADWAPRHCAECVAVRDGDSAE
jgi:hypothetical protein